MSRSSSNASKDNSRQTSKKGDLQGGMDKDPQFLTVPDSVKDKFPDAGEKTKQEGKHQHHHHHPGPTARKGSESGGSASKRIHHTRLHEKEKSKSRQEK